MASPTNYCGKTKLLPSTVGMAAATNGRAKEKLDDGGNKIHGMGLLCSLRKLTPPKKFRSTSENCSRSQFSTELAAAAVAARDLPWPDDEDDSSSSASLYFCPALNCNQKLSSRDEVTSHAQSQHSIVIAETPTESHSNSVEVSEDDMGPSETEATGAAAAASGAAWAPTMLAAFETKFFFETWRNDAGNWFMWVYHLGTPEESREFVADLEVCCGCYKLSYSGPVFSLMVPQRVVTTSGRCLSFTDGMAKSLLQPLEDGSLSGIFYKVQVRKCGERSQIASTNF